MRQTKEQLEDQVKYLEKKVSALNTEMGILLLENKVLTKQNNTLNDMIRALQVTTEAVAHVLADLKRR